MPAYIRAVPNTFDNRLQAYFAKITAPGIPWSPVTYGALFVLIAVWAVVFHSTWATWGTLSIDSGREMYVPLALRNGKMLYRDVWYPYGPVGPYLTSFLLRVFGVRLSVFYWQGALVALVSSIFLFLTGKRLGSWIAGWTAGVILVDFPLPYSVPAIYGCLVACFFLWCIAQTFQSQRPVWMFASGTAAALAFLLKLEYGFACYAVLSLFILARAFRQTNWQSTLKKDLLAIIPGLAACVLVVDWMISIAGVEFITQENIMSWPTAYYMKEFGKKWLAINGFVFSTALILWVVLCVASLLASIIGLRWLLSRSLGAQGSAESLVFTGLFVLIVGLVLTTSSRRTAAFFVSTFFCQAMVPCVAIGALFAWYLYARQKREGVLAVALLSTFAVLLAFRIAFKMSPAGIPIFYNGPVILSFLLFGRGLDLQSKPTRFGVSYGEAFLSSGCLLAAGLIALSFHIQIKDFVPLDTAAGEIKVTKDLANNYRASIAFLKEKSSEGELVLSVPEATSLYFLAGVDCPLRVLQFAPGTVAPGKMEDGVIRDINQKQIRYLIWDNREYPEYEVPEFGTDYNIRMGEYFRSHYRAIGPVVPENALAEPLTSSKPKIPPITAFEAKWRAVIWERVPEAR